MCNFEWSVFLLHCTVRGAVNGRWWRLYTRYLGSWATKTPQWGEAVTWRPQPWQTFHTAILYLFLHTDSTREKKNIIKSIGKVVLAQSVLFEVTGQIGTNWAHISDAFSWAAIQYTRIKTIHPPAHDSSQWMNRNIKQWTTEPLRGHLVPGKLQSAWQQHCRHSLFAAMYFGLPPPINTTCGAALNSDLSQPVRTQRTTFSWDQLNFLQTEQHTGLLPCKSNICPLRAISLRLWDNIWCIRLWNVCLSSTPELQLLWLHKDLGYTQESINIQTYSNTISSCQVFLLHFTINQPLNWAFNHCTDSTSICFPLHIKSQEACSDRVASLLLPIGLLGDSCCNLASRHGKAESQHGSQSLFNSEYLNRINFSKVIPMNRRKQKQEYLARIYTLCVMTVWVTKCFCKI